MLLKYFSVKSAIYYVQGTGTAWALLEDLPSLYHINVRQLGFSEEGMKAELDMGHMIICVMGSFYHPLLIPVIFVKPLKNFVLLAFLLFLIHNNLDNLLSDPLFLQWDPRWGYTEYGEDSFLGLSGCGPTCLSMVLYYLTGDKSLTKTTFTSSKPKTSK